MKVVIKNKRNFMIVISVLVLCVVLVIVLCAKKNAHSENPAGNEDSITSSNHISTNTNENKQDTNSDNQNDINNSNGEDDATSLLPPIAEKNDEVFVKGEIVTSDMPPKGDDKSALGIPDVIDTKLSDDGDLLVLVNKYHAVSKDYEPTDVVTIDNKYGTYQNMEMKSVCYEAYKKMYDDAKAQGFDLKLCSTLRSYDTQKMLYNNSLNNRGREMTNLRSAYPGRSEHHTGLALDITSKSMGWGLTQDFADYPDGKWLDENCQNYGFILRYPDGKTDVTGYAYEPWHFRYVGVEVAKYIMENGLTLEEYLER